MNKKNLISNIFFTIVFILFWVGIIVATFLLYLVSDFTYLGNGVLAYIFTFIYTLALILPIIFRKQITKRFSFRLSLVITSISSLMITGLVFIGARSYISSFSSEKWDSNEKLRYYMIDDLEEKHHITGMSKNDILKLLGTSAFVSDSKEISSFTYLIGNNMIDGIYYQIEFENDIAKSTVVITD